MSEISPTHREDIYQWNLAMTQSNKRKAPRSTLALFDKLISQHTDVKPDFITYLLALSACIRLSSLQDGKRIHHYLQQKWSTIVEKNEEVKVRTCLIQLYTTCGDLKTGERKRLNTRACSIVAVSSSRRDLLSQTTATSSDACQHSDERISDA
jgi:hypothetical protein